MCEHSFKIKIGEKLEYKKHKPFRVVKQYKCKTCGELIEIKGIKVKEHYQQIDLNTNKVI